jgi:hypothetical protein
VLRSPGVCSVPSSGATATAEVAAVEAVSVTKGDVAPPGKLPGKLAFGGFAGGGGIACEVSCINCSFGVLSFGRGGGITLFGVESALFLRADEELGKHGGTIGIAFGCGMQSDSFVSGATVQSIRSRGRFEGLAVPVSDEIVFDDADGGGSSSVGAAVALAAAAFSIEVGETNACCANGDTEN